MFDNPDFYYWAGTLMGFLFVALILVGIPVIFGTMGYRIAGLRGRSQWGWGITCAITYGIALIALAIIEPPTWRRNA